MLARELESRSIPTVTVTPMPDAAEHLLTPRILGVEFPFGHAFGRPGDRATQRRVLVAALTVLAGAAHAGTRVDLDLAWPEPRGAAYKSWQPAEPSPIVKMMLAAQQKK